MLTSFFNIVYFALDNSCRIIVTIIMRKIKIVIEKTITKKFDFECASKRKNFDSNSNFKIESAHIENRIAFYRNRVFL